MLPIVAGPEPVFVTVSWPCTTSCPLTVAVFVALMFQVTVFPLTDPVFVSVHFASLVSVTAAEAELSEMLAVPLIACETEVPSSPPSAHADRRTAMGSTRLADAMLGANIDRGLEQTASRFAQTVQQRSERV